MDTNTIINGDCLRIIKDFPDEIIDLTITSPPYNKQAAKGGLVKEVDYENSSDSLPEEVYQEKQIEILDEIWRATKEDGHMFYNHKTRWVNGKMIHPIEWLNKTKWTVRQEIIWDRMIAANLRGWRYWQVDERIYWLQRKEGPGEELESQHALLGSIWRFPPERDNDHPAPFPVELPCRIILSFLKEKGLVFDPYMGSGTTAVVAKELGHDWIGTDVSQFYIDMANKRIQNSSQESRKIWEEKEKHKVNKTYKDRQRVVEYQDTEDLFS